MKKTTIALLTAAAMGTSGAVMAADHGPHFAGDLRVVYSTNAGDTREDALSTNRLKLQVFGSQDAMAGTEAFYFFRLSADEDGVQEAVESDYALIGLRGDFGEVQVGRDDDLVYKFAGARTDLFRAHLPGGGAAGNATYATGPAGVLYENNGGESIQYSVNVDAVTVAGFVDTAESDNIDTAQLAVGFDFGMGNVAAVYSDRDTGAQSEFFGAATLSLDVVEISASMGRNEADNNPASLAVSGPLTGNVSYQLGYADDDAGISDAIGQVIIDLGGGFETFGSYRTGDSDDGFVLGAQYNF